jgi:hypothetical protein
MQTQTQTQETHGITKKDNINQTTTTTQDKELLRLKVWDGDIIPPRDYSITDISALLVPIMTSDLNKDKGA